MTSLRKRQEGFSAVEIVLVLVIVAAVVGVGYYVWHQGQSNQLSNNSSTPATTKAPAGTSASIDQITTQDAQTETAVDNGADKQTGQNATSADTALNNVGGAYNETSL